MGDTGTNPPTNEEWRARAEAAEAANHRLEVEARALVASLPADLVVHVQEGGGPEDVRATLAVSIAKVVGTLKEERQLHDGQVKTLAADFRRNQDQWQQHTVKLEAERDAARRYEEFQSDQMKAVEATAEARRKALQQALDESGCDGDLCAHRWHEAARTALVPVEPADEAKPCPFCAKPLNYPRITIGDGALIGWQGAGGRKIVRDDVVHAECYWKARFEKAEAALRTYRQEARRQWETPVCAWGCEHPTGVEVMDGAPPKLDCDEATLAEAERKYTEAVKAHALSCPNHPLAVRAVKAEAEVKRVRELIDRDRTGLAAGLVAVVDVAKGYWWLADGGWGSHEEKDRTEATLREEFTNALELMSEICKRHLTQSGHRANAAFHGGPGPAESINLGRVMVLLDRQRETWRATMSDLEALARKQQREVREALKAAETDDPARQLREQIAAERAALIGMIPNDLLIRFMTGSPDEDAAQTLRAGIREVLRVLAANRDLAGQLQVKMGIINDALDEFGVQHHHDGDSSVVECVQEAMTTLRANLAKERAEISRLRRAEKAEADLRRFVEDIDAITDSIPARFVLRMGGVDAQERARATLATAVGRTLETLVRAEDRALELSAQLDGTATRVSDAILSVITSIAPADLAILANIARAAVKATIDPRTASALMQIQRQLHATEGKLSQARHMVDEQRALIERMEAKAAEEMVTAEGRAKQSGLDAVYLQTALRVANEMLAERLGVEPRHHPLGLAPMEMLGAAREVDNEEVSRLRSLIWSASQPAGVVSEVVDGMVHVRMPGIPAPPAPAAKTPTPMLLWCPSCHARHVDKGELATKPHHTHACQGCGLPWRPAIEPTVGVQYLPGFKDEEPQA